MVTMVKIACAVCGKEFEREEWRLKQRAGKENYCSIKCSSSVVTKRSRPGAQRKVTLTCHMCGKTFQRKPSDASDRTRQFCTRACWTAWTKSEEGRSVNIGYIG